MDLLEHAKHIFGKECQFEMSGNYYFQRHLCPSNNNEEVKIMMDFRFSKLGSETVINIGKCKDCGKVFYHETIDSRRI